MKRVCAPLLAFLATALMEGCSSTLQIGGAYFPAWLLSIIAGVFFGGVVMRVVFVKLDLDPWIRPRALAYPAMVLFFVLLTYFLFFR